MKMMLPRLRATGLYLAHTPEVRRLIYPALLALIALLDWNLRALDRRTFAFPTIKDGAPAVEIRILPGRGAAENRLARYVEEYLLGPASVESGPLFTPGSRLRSLLLRDGVVYVDLSREAAVPYADRPDLRESLAILADGLRRNFPFTRDVRFFIQGRQPYLENFARISPEAHEKK